MIIKIIKPLGLLFSFTLSLSHSLFLSFFVFLLFSEVPTPLGELTRTYLTDSSPPPVSYSLRADTIKGEGLGINSAYLSVFLLAYFPLNQKRNIKNKTEGERKVSSFMIIYSWTFKLLMRTNEVVFQSVSMKHAFPKNCLVLHFFFSSAPVHVE